jgi:hypothetical protein
MTPEALKDCSLHLRTPFMIENVSHSRFSVARFYGGISYNNEHYVYFPDTDSLVRSDVLAWLKKKESAEDRALKEKRALALKRRQPKLFED